VLVLGAALVMILMPVGMASAGAVDSDATGGALGPDPTTSPVPVVLARTGLDLTTPVVVGLSILLLGTALVAWAVLRGSAGSGRRTRD
jgi:hypothetical protein